MEAKLKELKDIKKCHICGCYEYRDAEKNLTEEEFDILQEEDKIISDIVECEYCGQPVCDANDNESCGEIVNYDQTYCNDCVKKLGKTDCDRCKTDHEDCWCGREYAYIVGDCPDFNDEEQEEEL